MAGRPAFTLEMMMFKLFVVVMLGLIYLELLGGLK
jgi:hypothetical protein